MHASAYTVFLLVSGTQEVVHGLDRIEGRGWNFHKDCVPLAHGAVPQAGELEGTQVAAIEGFLADEAGVMVHVVGQMVGLTVGAAQVAHKVHGVEVGGLLHHFFILGFGEVNLG